MRSVAVVSDGEESREGDLVIRKRVVRAVQPVLEQGLGRAGVRLVYARGRVATILDDDRLIVSYPRSGNTWLSFLLTNLTHPEEPTTFLNLDFRCPDIYQQSDRYLLGLPRPRLMKSHEPFDGRYRRVVYLVRDPRDVAVSYYRFLAKERMIDRAMPMSDFIDGFVTGVWDADRGAWGEHVGSWLGARGSDDVMLVVRYEDLHREPEQQLARVASFLEIPNSRELCVRAVSLATPERMRELEATQLKDTRSEIPFVGPAEVGRGRVELEPGDQSRIVQRWRDTMEDLGYEPS